MRIHAMDPVERRRNQNRMAQRRFRSKKASESGKRPSSAAASSEANDATSTGSTTFNPYHSADGNVQTSSNPTTTVLSHESKVVSKSAAGSMPPASTDLLSSLPENVEDMLLPDGRDGFSVATSSLKRFAHQAQDQTMSLPRPPQSSIAQSTSLTEADDFPYMSSSLNDKLPDPLHLMADSDIHASLSFTNSPDNPFYIQPSPADSGPNFSLPSDQLTPCSLHNCADNGSITLSATNYQIEFCQDCSALRLRSPLQISARDSLRGPLIKLNGDKESISAAQGNGDKAPDDNAGEAFESNLHIAAESGHGDLVDMLIRSGSTIDDPDSEGNTPLHRATNRQKLQVIQRLLEHGANPNVMNAAGRTPVHIAVSIGSVEIVESLVRFGGDLNRRARRQSTRMDL